MQKPGSIWPLRKLQTRVAILSSGSKHLPDPPMIYLSQSKCPYAVRNNKWSISFKLRSTLYRILLKDKGKLRHSKKNWKSKSLQYGWRTSRPMLQISRSSDAVLPSICPNVTSQCMHLSWLKKNSNAIMMRLSLLPVLIKRKPKSKLKKNEFLKRKSSMKSLQTLSVKTYTEIFYI